MSYIVVYKQAPTLVLCLHLCKEKKNGSLKYKNVIGVLKFAFLTRQLVMLCSHARFQKIFPGEGGGGGVVRTPHPL